MKPIAVSAHAAQQSGSVLTPFEYAIEAVGPHEVVIEVSHCGICHSDLHLIDNDWGNSTYPLVPGHEVVGHVVEKGASVGLLSVGERVGVGWQAGACLECDPCVSGQENLCRQSVATCVGRYGGFGSHVKVDARFAFSLPEKLDAATAAPLLCGGVTVFSPFQHYGVRSWHKVGVVGVGGLGHLALQFARRMGCEVTAFSSTRAKEAEAKDLGAHHFVATAEDNWPRAVRGQLDFILVTATADLDWVPYVRALGPNGKLCFVSGADSLVNVPIGLLLNGQRRVGGSAIGGRHVMRQMLAFSARHGVQAMAEMRPMSDVNAALDHLRAGKARYRMVLER